MVSSFYQKIALSIRILLFFIFLLALQTVISFLLIKNSSRVYVHNSLTSFSNRVAHDILVKNGKWDMRLYDADPATPHPTGSSGFPNPLYIITTNGFVIERNEPVHGFLDSSDFKQVLMYSKPTTITSPTNERWRVFAMPIQNNNDTIGAILVAYFNPSDEVLSDIDDKLKSNLLYLSAHTNLLSESIDVSQIDIRNVSYDVSFEIIDNFNRVLLNNGRTPSFIDRSYVADIMNVKAPFTVRDTKTSETFSVVSKPIVDKYGKVYGVIVTGQSTAALNSLLSNYLLYSALVDIILLIPLSILTSYVLRRQIRILFTYRENEKKKIEQIEFDRNKGVLKVNDETIEIPYASNQYYLCDAVFSEPEKRWENDELLTKFGETDFAPRSRKVYDAMLAINRKAGIHLVDRNEKTYRLNPEYVSKITQYPNNPINK